MDLLESDRRGRVFFLCSLLDGFSFFLFLSSEGLQIFETGVTARVRAEGIAFSCAPGTPQYVFEDGPSYVVCGRRQSKSAKPASPMPEQEGVDFPFQHLLIPLVREMPAENGALSEPDELFVQDEKQASLIQLVERVKVVSNLLKRGASLTSEQIYYPIVRFHVSPVCACEDHAHVVCPAPTVFQPQQLCHACTVSECCSVPTATTASKTEPAALAIERLRTRKAKRGKVWFRLEGSKVIMQSKKKTISSANNAGTK